MCYKAYTAKKEKMFLFLLVLLHVISVGCLRLYECMLFSDSKLYHWLLHGSVIILIHPFFNLLKFPLLLHLKS